MIGVAELDPRTHGTVYCTMLFIGREGRLLGRHRKLKPTHAERIAWGDGDASGLCVHERSYGRISGLNCWEHQMVLPGYALIAQGTQVHVSTWPGREPEQAPSAPTPLWPRQLLLSRAFASQAACYVVASAGVLRPADVPERYRDLIGSGHTGQSCIIDPRGEIIAGPAPEGEDILVARGCSLEAVMAAKAACDTAGHYARHDIFKLLVDGRPVGAAREKPDAEPRAGL
ncbi:hypothetical protein JMJ55_04355 [Belnapia sp. T6]|uniref:CN hydrolase domain-containing protein n=1 Tax=Belnapia mucosa TaxID=2804532 RepID=A0ABS1UYJ5_9PROT|nr:nitrilase-related carbon-nitrogen hydrolase [Belnapia mucosa]MBL6454544.1 hypothetical protein [Belnapia mucosa]